MTIDIMQPPPPDIPRIRWKYTRLSIVFLVLTACSLVIGAAGIFLRTGHDEIIQHTAFVLFLIFGLAFVYSAEKLLGSRRLRPSQQEELQAMRRQYSEVEKYCRNVAAQDRYLVVDEFDAIAAYVDTVKEKESAPKR